MLTAYFDESGHSSATEFFSLAAFVAEDSEWSRFSDAWLAALQRSGAPYLHMREFAHRVGPFEGWDEEQRRTLLADCVTALKSIRAIAVGAATSVSDFQALDAEARSKLQDPYFCCFQEAVRGAALNALFEAEGVGVRMVFSQQDEFSSMARQLWDVLVDSIDVADRMESLAFDDMRTVPGLQAADLLAYELRHYYHLRKTRPGAAPRWPFAQLVQHQRTALNARLLKFLPAWYLRAQADSVFDGIMAAMLADPDAYAEQLNELEPELPSD